MDKIFELFNRIYKIIKVLIWDINANIFFTIKCLDISSNYHPLLIHDDFTWSST
jgi:hypothetical protein